MINLFILLLTVFLCWILYSSVVLYNKMIALRKKSSIALVNTTRNSGKLRKKLKTVNISMSIFLFVRKLQSILNIVRNIPFIAGLFVHKKENVNKL